jgi:hypothetical protein
MVSYSLGKGRPTTGAKRHSHHFGTPLFLKERPMNNRKPKRQGDTVPVQGETQERVPRMPHEHDESAESQSSGEPSGRAIGQAAHEDVERGLVDTDKGPALDQAYHKLREGADSSKKFSP